MDQEVKDKRENGSIRKRIAENALRLVRGILRPGEANVVRMLMGR